MILPDFIIPSRANAIWQTTGMDSEKLCADLAHYRSYPHEIEYRYNNRGYRDDAWPANQSLLQQAIWCIGDSFTVGIGNPREHTWPYLLQQAMGQRTINVSMDGASNTWISRKAIVVLDKIAPKLMILHWSYVNRREKDIEQESSKAWEKSWQAIRDPSWPKCRWEDRYLLPKHILEELNTMHGGIDNIVRVPDEHRILHYEKCTDEEDVQHTLKCIHQVCQAASGTDTLVIHTFIPYYVSDQFRGQIESQIPGYVIPQIKALDFGRDGHHYGEATARNFVDQIQRLL